MSLCAPPNGSPITSSMTFNLTKSLDVNFRLLAAISSNPSFCHNIEAQPSGEITQ